MTRWQPLVTALLIVQMACNGPAMTPSSRSEQRPAHEMSSPVEQSIVVRVIDGDTIVVAGDAPDGARVRLIGIDTPERDECMHGAATRRMQSLVDGKRVRLLRDVSHTDRYGRLLRYVYAGEVFVNAAMVSEGFASAATFPPDVSHAGEFVQLERDARLHRRGLWSESCSS